MLGFFRPDLNFETASEKELEVCGDVYMCVCISYIKVIF